MEELSINQYMTREADGEDYFALYAVKMEDLVDLAGMFREHARSMAGVVRWGLDQGEAAWFIAEAQKWEERGLRFQAFVDEHFEQKTKTDVLRYREMVPDDELTFKRE